MESSVSDAGELTSFRRALQILDLLSMDGDGMTVEQLAARLGFSSSTTYRYVRALREEHLVEEIQSGVYHLGVRIMMLARAARGPANFIQRARPALEHLTSVTDSQSFLARFTDQVVICLDSAEPRVMRPFRIAVGPGDLVPLNVGAAAKAILAQLPREHAWSLLKRAQAADLGMAPRRSRSNWQAEVSEIKRRGYAVSDWMEDGVRALSAPIFCPRDQLAAVSIAGPVRRLSDERLPSLTRHLCAAAEEIGKRLSDF
ncbi:MAG: IclR family transcriptional regulator [Candidatus Binataceae bacterium]